MWRLVTNHYSNVILVNILQRTLQLPTTIGEGLAFPGRTRNLSVTHTSRKAGCMTNHSEGMEGGDDSSIPVALYEARLKRMEVPVRFDRKELDQILRLYGRMVAAGHWRDYGLLFDTDLAVFAAFRRSAERPEVRVEKRPSLQAKQGAWALIGEHGTVLKRGHDLAGVLAPLERRLLKIVG